MSEALEIKKGEVIAACRNLGFAWQRERILDGVSFEIRRGDFAIIMGGNGTGKSTLMRLLLHEMDAQEGSVELFGVELAHFKGWTRLAYLPQNAIERNQAFPATAYEIVKAHLHHRRRADHLSRAEVHRRTMDALGRVGMGEFAKSLISELSGGQQQRVLLAGVIAAKPELMLLDEPTSGIDFENSLILYNSLRHMQREMGLTILMITHDTAHAAEYADRVFCLEGGSLMELTRDQVEEEAKHRHRHPNLQEAEQAPESFCCWEGCPNNHGGAKHV